jgi:hypothetical protein
MRKHITLCVAALSMLVAACGNEQKIKSGTEYHVKTTIVAIIPYMEDVAVNSRHWPNGRICYVTGGGSLRFISEKGDTTLFVYDGNGEAPKMQICGGGSCTKTTLPARYKQCPVAAAVLLLTDDLNGVELASASGKTQ